MRACKFRERTYVPGAMSAQTTTRPPRTHDDLRRGSRHIYFEHRMLINALRALSRMAPEGPTGPIGNGPSGLFGEYQAWAECFCIHARNLTQFLHEVARVDLRDIMARDYIPTWDPARLGAPPDIDRLHRTVAHLTWHRVERPDDLFPEFAVIGRTIESGMRHFHAEVDRALLNEWWDVAPWDRVVNEPAPSASCIG